MCPGDRNASTTTTVVLVSLCGFLELHGSSVLLISNGRKDLRVTYKNGNVTIIKHTPLPF